MAQSVLSAEVKLVIPPARLVVHIFGEAGAAAIADVSIDALRKWRRRKATGGGGGCVPSRYQKAFLDAARTLGKPLTAEQLIAEPY